MKTDVTDYSNKNYLFVFKILTYCTMLWDSKLRNLTFAWLQDVQYLAICYFLRRNPSMVPTLTCQEPELCTAPAISKAIGKFDSQCAVFINDLEMKCSNNTYQYADIIYPGTELLPCLKVHWKSLPPPSTLGDESEKGFKEILPQTGPAHSTSGCRVLI